MTDGPRPVATLHTGPQLQFTRQTDNHEISDSLRHDGADLLIVADGKVEIVRWLSRVSVENDHTIAGTSEEKLIMDPQVHDRNGRSGEADSWYRNELDSMRCVDTSGSGKVQRFHLAGVQADVHNFARGRSATHHSSGPKLLDGPLGLQDLFLPNHH